jgi:hypothetical protein
VFQEQRALRVFGPPGLSIRLAIAVSSWIISVLLVTHWRLRQLSSGVMVTFVALELGALFYLGPVPWGRSIPFPQDSPIMHRLKAEAGVGLVAGALDNLPLRSELTPAFPYLGITPPPPNYLLEAATRLGRSTEPPAPVLLRHFGVTHGVWHEHDIIPGSSTVFVSFDRALDRATNSSNLQRWKIVRYRDPRPAAWICRRATVLPGWQDVYSRLIHSADADEACYIDAEAPANLGTRRASSARIARFQNDEALVEHDGTCDLVIRRAHYPGWTCSVNGGPPQPVSKADGGLQAVRLEGEGPSFVRFSYQPTRWKSLCRISAFAIFLTVGTLAKQMWKRSHDPIW